MSYEISDTVRAKIFNIPSFKTEVYKIKNLPGVLDIYDIDPDETIISYRIIPQPFAKLEKGGAIFTDRGVYRRLPSGYLSSDFVSYGVKYEEMVKFIPFLGYSVNQQPQLVGEYTGMPNLSFWLTPVAGIDSNDEIVSVFGAIIDDVISQDEEKKREYNETKKKCLEYVKTKFESEGIVFAKDKAILSMLADSDQFEEGEEPEAVILLFKIDFAYGNYSEAYNLLEKHADIAAVPDFSDQVDKVIRSKIEEIGIPDNAHDADVLELFCRKDSQYVNMVFSNLITYYFKTGDFKAADAFVDNYGDDELKAKFTEKIGDTLPIKVQDWTVNTDSGLDEGFVEYAMGKPEFYRMAAEELVKHYCEVPDFEKAEDCLAKVKAVKNDEKYLEDLKAMIKKYVVIYAADQYRLGEERISAGKGHEAIPYLKEAVKYNPDNEVYVLTLIETEIDLKDYDGAKKVIGDVLENRFEFDQDGDEKFHQLEIRRAEAVNERMKKFYEMLADGNFDSLKKDYDDLAETDQLGLSFYHYAVLMKKNEMVEKINVSKSDAAKPVSGYELLDFGAGDEKVDITFIQMLKLYDDDAKKLYSDYKWKKAGNTAKKIGTKIAIGAMDTYERSTRGADENLKKKAMKAADSSELNRIKDKIEALRDRRKKVQLNKEKAQKYSDENIQTSGEMYDDYADLLVQLAKKKVVIFSNRTDEAVENDSVRSKLIYMIIKKPELLEEIFHGDRSEFTVYEEKNDYLYLPAKLIEEAKALTVEYNPRKIPEPELMPDGDSEDN